jgi:hypothetical protein
MQRGRMLIAALLALPAFPTEWSAAQEVVRDEFAKQGAIYPIEVLHKGTTWMPLPAWLEAEQKSPLEIKDDFEFTSRISEAAFDLWVYGEIKNSPLTAKARLDAHLHATVEDLATKHHLSLVQQQKLHLAGRGDIKRLFDRAEESRMRFQTPAVRDKQEMRELRQEFTRESKRLRSEIKDPFGSGSLLAKTLNHVRHD